MTRRLQKENRRRLALGVGLGAGFVAALWLAGSLWLEQGAKSAAKERHGAGSSAESGAEPQAESGAASRTQPRAHEPRRVEAPSVPPASEPKAAPQPDSITALVVSPERPREAHPLDEAHRQIQRKNQLNQAANDAVDSGRAAELREVLDVYERLDPQDESGLQLGYRTILQCLEEPGAASTAAAERFIVEHRASILRRFVRRHCIGDR